MIEVIVNLNDPIVDRGDGSGTIRSLKSLFFGRFSLRMIWPRALFARYHCSPDEAADTQCCAIQLGATYLTW
jgi:hypothetical protein